MREAIRQRLEQEEGTAAPETQEEHGYRPPATSGNAETYTPSSSFDAPTRDTDYSFLNTGRHDRGLTPLDLPTLPTAPQEEPSWLTAEPAGPLVTLVAADTVWHGTLRSSGQIRIEGTFEGQIDTEAALHIAPTAKVEATVRAASIVVAGQLSGQINCRERLEVLPSGRVSGQIDAGRFIVHEGAFLGGQVRMRPAGEAAGGDDSRPMLQRVR